MADISNKGIIYMSSCIFIIGDCLKKLPFPAGMPGKEWQCVLPAED